MLVLARKQEESIIIGDSIEIKVLEIRGDQIRVGIIAPYDIPIYRKELYEKIKQANVEAVKSKQEKVTVPFKEGKGGGEAESSNKAPQPNTEV